MDIVELQGDMFNVVFVVFIIAAIVSFGFATTFASLAVLPSTTR